MNIKIFTDWFLAQGSTHRICQDYTWVGENYAIIADGCSSSKYKINGKKHPAPTDMGARLLCHSAKYFLELQRGNVPAYKTFGIQVIAFADLCCQMLHLPVECLDATLMVAFVQNGSIHVYRYGDGYLIYEDANAKHYMKFEYSGNAPYYLSYWNDDDRRKRYEDEYGGECEFSASVSGDEWEVKNKVREIECASEYFVTDKSTTVTLLSDGAVSFLSKYSGKIIPYADLHVLNHFTELKPGGAYIRRRWNVANKVFKKDKIEHTDDLSIAGIHIKSEG